LRRRGVCRLFFPATCAFTKSFGGTSHPKYLVVDSRPCLAEAFSEGGSSHRQRGERRKLQIPDFASSQLEALERKKASRTWAALIKRVFEVDPLVCQKCGSTMKIKSFITNQHEIVRLLANLGVSPFERPEPIRGRGPPQSELILEPTPESDS
jgi:hypothetical protein